MRTKENARKLVRKQNVRIFKVFGVVILTLAALLATSIIGPSRNGKVHAFTTTATIDLPTNHFTDSFGTTTYQVINTTVPGPYNIAKYHSELSAEGVRGSIDPLVALFLI